MGVTNRTLACFAYATIFACSLANSQSACSDNAVQVTYVGHAAFTLTTQSTRQLLIDPFASRIWIGYDFPVERINPDIVLITHPHYDHDGGEYRNGHSLYPGPARTYRWPGKWEQGEFTLLGVKGQHAAPYGKEFGSANTIWKVVAEGVSYVHLGDNGSLDATVVDELGDVDVLFLPADGEEHIITHEQTSVILAELQPRIVIPMHYRIDELEKDGSPGDLGNITDWLVDP